MAPTDQNEPKGPRTAKDVINSAASQIKKAKADAFQQKAKAILDKIETAKTTLAGLEAELEAAADQYDAQ